MFKDKLQESSDKNTVELDIDIRAATTNVIFIDEDMVDFVGIQDGGDDNDNEGNQVTSQCKIIRKRRLQAVSWKREKAPRIVDSISSTLGVDLLERPLQVQVTSEELIPKDPL